MALNANSWNFFLFLSLLMLSRLCGVFLTSFVSPRGRPSSAAATGGGGAVTVAAATGNALLDTQSTEPTLPLLPVDGDKVKW